jgi:glycosyltransferase involved in cell wall biosynthesis
LFSVIIPTCDRFISLRNAVESVTRQTYEVSEIIIVNNGREKIDKENFSLIKKYSEKLKIINIEPYVGVSKARNCGANIASGKYLAFLDDDDQWPENYIEIANDHISDVDRDCFISDIRMYKNNKIVAEKINKYENFNKYNLFIRNPGFGGSNIIIKKNAFMLVNGYNEKLTTSEDKALLIELLRVKASLFIVPNNYIRASTDDSLSLTRNTWRQISGIFRFIIVYRKEMSFAHVYANLIKCLKLLRKTI